MNRRKSYFCAKDDSIVLLDDEDQQAHSIQVALRIRGQNHGSDLYEVEGNNFIAKWTHANKLDVAYSFSKIFHTNSSQVEIFNKIVKPKFLDFINGNHFSLLAYGISGAGKTYTIIGNNTEPGIIPRSLEYLFRSVPSVSASPRFIPLDNGQVKELQAFEVRAHIAARKIIISPLFINNFTHHVENYDSISEKLQNETFACVDDANVQCDIWVSFAEIHNENVYDLLSLKKCAKATERPRLKICNVQGCGYIKGVTSVHISTDKEAYLLLQYGLNHLNYASTGMNHHSSRSHCIFTIKLIQYVGCAEPIMSYFNLCDLAGSESQKNSLNEGDRLRESNSINKSLLTLHKCLQKARDLQKSHHSGLVHVPFRESKLTQLLQRGLAGHESMNIIININPLPNTLEDTERVLKFASLTQTIVVKHEMESKRTEILTYSHNSVEEEEEELVNELARIDEEIERTEFTVEMRRAIVEQLCAEIDELVMTREKNFRAEHGMNELWREEVEELRRENRILDAEIKSFLQKAPPGAERDDFMRRLAEVDTVVLSDSDRESESGDEEVIEISDEDEDERGDVDKDESKALIAISDNESDENSAGSSEESISRRSYECLQAHDGGIGNRTVSLFSETNEHSSSSDFPNCRSSSSGDSEANLSISNECYESSSSKNDVCVIINDIIVNAISDSR